MGIIDPTKPNLSRIIHTAAAAQRVWMLCMCVCVRECECECECVCECECESVRECESVCVRATWREKKKGTVTDSPAAGAAGGGERAGERKSRSPQSSHFPGNQISADNICTPSVQVRASEGARHRKNLLSPPPQQAQLDNLVFFLAPLNSVQPWLVPHGPPVHLRPVLWLGGAGAGAGLCFRCGPSLPARLH